ncbi:hypothetical protein ACOMHN_063713 [Nucella lapillus]
MHDCLDHQDEEGCEDLTCPGFFRCRVSTTCVHNDHLCDGWSHCPLHDDELLCDVTCPVGCLCQGHTFLCFQPFSATLFPQLRYLDATGSGQALIYWSIQKSTLKSDTTRVSRDMTIARRLITVAVTDFMCWFPIGTCGLLAQAGVPIPVEVNVALAIFVLPMNSAINPFMYTFNTLAEKHKKSNEAKLVKWLESRADMIII